MYHGARFRHPQVHTHATDAGTALDDKGELDALAVPIALAAKTQADITIRSPCRRTR